MYDEMYHGRLGLYNVHICIYIPIDGQAPILNSSPTKKLIQGNRCSK